MGRVQAEDEFEQGTLTGTGAARDGDRFPFLDGQGQVAEDIFTAVAKGSVVDNQRRGGKIQVNPVSRFFYGMGENSFRRLMPATAD